MKVALVCHAALGGSSQVALRLACALAAEGDEVHLLCPGEPIGPIAGGVRLHVVEAPTHPVLDASPHALAMAGALVELAQREGLDVIHAHFAVPWAVALDLTTSTLGRPSPAMVLTLHGSDVFELGCDPRIAAPLRASLARMHALTAPSAWLAETALATLGLREPVEVVSNFIAAEPPARGDLRVPVLAHISNFRPVKRSLDAIEIFAQLRAQMPARLRLIGDGPEHAAALARARALGVDADVEAIGVVEHAPDHLDDVALVLVPSAREAFGLAALEAQVRGIPVIGSRVDGLPEVVSDGETGLLYPPGDLEAMAEAALALLTDPPRHAAMGSTARARALARFSPEAAVARYRAVYARARRRAARDAA